MTIPNPMRWENLHIQNKQVGGGPEMAFGPGKRWGHTCNSIRGGKLLYVFGGYAKDVRQTNQIHVFDTATKIWSVPAIKGTPPAPRDSHTCTTVGDNLFVFGGTDGQRPLKDLHILDTASNTWISPNVRGDGPEGREGHSAALIGKRLFIFGGSGGEFFDDLYILNTETFVWKRAVTSGNPPAKRESHTCSSWKNKIIVIGGEDSFDYYLSDVHILDADTLVWRKLNTSGQLLPPRAGHTTVALGKNLFVFGGFTDEQDLYNDTYMLDVDSGLWSKVITTGEGPSPRFSMAGDNLDPQKMGVLVFMGGCNKSLEALDDLYYLHTGLTIENERDERRVEKLSLRKQLKLKCQEQHTLSTVHDRAVVRVETPADLGHKIPVPSYVHSSRQNVYLNEYQTPLGKRTFQAKVSKSFADGYTIETIIDGKPLRGVLFSDKPSVIKIADSNRKTGNVGIVGTKLNEDDNSKSEAAGSLEQDVIHDRQANHDQAKNSVSSEPLMDADAASRMEKCVPSDSFQPLEVSGASIPSMESDQNLIDIKMNVSQHPSSEVLQENTAAKTVDCISSPQIMEAEN